MSELRKTIWESMLDADMNTRYFAHLGRRVQKLEKRLTIFLALMSSSVIGSWKLWNDTEAWHSFSFAWQLLCGAAAILAVALPILDYPKQISTLAQLKGAYSTLLTDYEILWSRLSRLKIGEADNEFRRIRTKEDSLSTLEAHLPFDRKLVLKCQVEVRSARRL